jgi:hypothetical protein
MFQLIRKDSGEGIVYAAGEGRILVAVLKAQDAGVSPKKSCGDKAGCGHCGGCASLPDAYTDKFHVPVPDTGAFKVGDRVGFNRYVPEPVITGLLVFGLPISLAVAAMILWLRYAPELAESLWVLLTIAAAFTVGVAALGALDKLFKKRYPVTITGSLDSCGTGIGGNINGEEPPR